MTNCLDWLIKKPIAHRGFHNRDTGVHENSMSAFVAAMDAGFAIECDIQITSDRKVVVFHDSDLGRLTAEKGAVRHRTAADLAKISIRNSTDTIRCLDEYLEMAAGKTPLLLELKGVMGEDNGLVRAVAKSLANYQGQVAVMTFNHWLLRQLDKYITDRPMGLTALGDDGFYDFHMNIAAETNVDFVSYKISDLPCRFVADIKNKHHIPIITWTVRSPEDRAVAAAHADQVTFEGYDPRD